MPRWLETLLTLVIFTAVMAVIDVGVRAAVPDVHAWLIANIGHVGVWAGLSVVSLLAVVAVYHGHRRPMKRERKSL